MSRLNRFLSGIKVLDLSRHLPGPLATLILADMGADVTKIESPAGDEMRVIGPRAGGEESAAFRALNGCKRQMQLDLKAEGDLETFLALAREADVLVESFRPGTMERLGLGVERLRAANRGLIYCALSGFGRAGPWRDRAGHDVNYLALNGMLGAVAGETGTPVAPYPPPADLSASLFGAIAILGALNARARDGQGCDIDLALADAPLPLLAFSLAELGVRTGRIGGAEGLLGGGAAYYCVYPTSDGRHVSIAPIEPKFWRAFCAAAGRADWVARYDEAFPQPALRGEIAAMFAGMTAEEAAARFEPADCCFAVVQSLADAVDSPSFAARGLLQRGDGGMVHALFPALVDGEAPEPRVLGRL